jgi:copper homeostasis protein
MQSMMELEICVDSVESAIAAEAGGAQRVELCSALAEGGLTPSVGLIRAVRSAVKIGVYLMIRPRGGDFLYSDAEYAIMHEDIAAAADAGANGVVFGLLTAQGEVDLQRTRRLIKAAQPMEVTIHRAIDMSRDPVEALEASVEAGATRVLTSGGAATAQQGADRIATMLERASGRVGVMVGGNVRPKNLLQLAAATGASQFHAAMRTAVPSRMSYRNTRLHLGDAGSDEYGHKVVLARDVRHLREAMDAVAGTRVPVG